MASFSSQLIFLGKTCYTSLATFSLSDKMDFYQLFSLWKIILFSFYYAYKWKKKPLSYPGTLPGKWEENVPAQHSSVIKTISRTAKPSARERNWTFLYSDSVSCGCCYIAGEGCYFQGGLSVLFQPCQGGVLGDGLAGRGGPPGLRCEWHLGLLSPGETRHFCQKRRVVKLSALQEKRKPCGNLGTSRVHWGGGFSILILGFSSAVLLFCLSLAENAEELFCIALLAPC